MTLDDVAAFAATLPEVVEGERYGGRTWSVRGKVFAWERKFSKADIKRYGKETPPPDPILAVSVAHLDEKEALLAARPRAFFTIPHFDGYAAILVRLDVVTKKDLHAVLLDGWRARAPATLKTPRRSR